jgi:hypothetical protein
MNTENIRQEIAAVVNDLIPDRVDEMFFLWGNILPIYSETNKAALEGLMGAGLADVIPQIMKQLSQLCMDYPDDFNGYLEFIKEAIDYMRGDSNNSPAVDTSELNEKVQEEKQKIN